MQPTKPSRSFRTLMFPAALHLLQIKDLKDLSVFLGRGYYRHAGPTDLKRCFHVNARGGQAPALRLSRPSLFHRRARACPSPCLGRGNGFGWRSVFAQIGRSRGTGPRATGSEGSLRHAPFGIRRSRTTVSCSSLANRDNRVNPAPLLRILLRIGWQRKKKI